MPGSSIIAKNDYLNLFINISEISHDSETTKTFNSGTISVIFIVLGKKTIKCEMNKPQLVTVIRFLVCGAL